MGSQIDPEVLKSTHPRWSRAGLFWGPACPQDEAHGGLIDIQGSETWYCRHSAHQGNSLYSYDQLVALEIDRITASETSESEDLQSLLPQAEE